MDPHCEMNAAIDHPPASKMPVLSIMQTQGAYQTISVNAPTGFLISGIREGVAFHLINRYRSLVGPRAMGTCLLSTSPVWL